MANIFSKHRSKLREQSKKQKGKKKDLNQVSSIDHVSSDEGSIQKSGAHGSGPLIKCQILSLSHEGRGISKNKGKTQFVHQALPDELVLAEVLAHRSKYDELKTVEVLKASSQRVAPKCQYFGECGGCSLQHLSHSAQLEHKEHVLLDQLQRFGDIAPDESLPATESEAWGYRSRTKLSVDYGRKGSALRVGFRKKNSKEILDIDVCPILEDSLANSLPLLKQVIQSLSVDKLIGHAELSSSNEGVGLLLRLVKPLKPVDRDKLKQFAEDQNWRLYLQPDEVSSIYQLYPEDTDRYLSYDLNLDNQQITLSFHPKDFTQINLGVNQKMVQLALNALDIQAGERVLDLFSGLGNFTLAMAKGAVHAVGVEGSQELVKRGEDNAKLNQIDNVSFYKSNLYDDFSSQVWAQESYDRILIDPPRSGALEVVSEIAKFQAKRIVYISCNPATLARDAGVLAQQGYILRKAGVLDMFPHTEHLESIAIFDRQ